jgi:alpha-L-rhamnosidase
MPTLSRLRCEYQTEPLGLGETSPRLSWELSEGTQVAYRVQTDNGWDTGRVESDQSIALVYAGPALQSRQRVTWTVTVWSEAGEASASSWWEMGLLAPGDWEAKWIEGPLAGGPYSKVPAAVFQREIDLRDVASARLYVTALGIVDFRINGERTTDAELLPGWTDYRKRVRYSVHDVSSLLRSGEQNVLEATLGSGWYCGKIGWRERAFYGDRPRLLAQLEVTTKGGDTVVLGTDESWSVFVGQTLHEDLLDGEAIDARRGLTPLGAARLSPPYEGELNGWNSPPIRPVRVLQPISREKNLFDFGQNLVGRIHIRATGKGGETITLRVAERLNEGKLYTANYRKAQSTDYFTLAEGENDLTTRFTFHGFQYAELQGLPEGAEVEAVVLSSDLEPVGAFSCSEPLLNQLWHNIEWGWRGNSLDVPTDCPQRDERLGWTGDAQVFVRTSMFLSDAQTFWEKYSTDLADSQKEDGRIPPVAPDPGADFVHDGGPAWSDAVVICPWTVYRCTGDARILERNYDSMRRWVDWLATSSRDGIRVYEGYDKWRGFGDWLNTQAETPNEIIGTAFYAHVARLLSKIERVLGQSSEVYDRLADEVQAAFVREFGARLETQTANVLALHFDLLPPEQRSVALTALVADIESRGDHLSTGFVGTPYLPYVLTEGGRLDVAYRLLLQKSWPGYLYAVTQGATTIWERWDGWTEDKGFQDVGMNSFNHYAYGAIGDWMASVVAGIDLDPQIPGYRRSLLRPRPGGGLTHAAASLKTGYGRLASGWRIENDRFEWTVEVPPNTTARATLPPEAGAESHELAPGTHRFSAVWNSGG